MNITYVEELLMNSTRIYTIKKVGDEVVVNSIGFVKRTTLDKAAQLADCDHGELRYQLQKRGGMTHVIRRGHQHWYT